MTYDYYSPGWFKFSSHHSALFENPHNPSTKVKKIRTVAYAANYYIRQGAPREKILIGIPFVSKGWGCLVNAGSPQAGLYNSSNCAPQGYYDQYQEQQYWQGINPWFYTQKLEQNASFVKFWDNYSKNSYLFS